MKLDIDERQSDGIVIELLPLVDVVFCILTFFILAAVGSRQQAISLDLPNASTGAALPPAALTTGRDRLYVSVDPIGRIYLDQDPILEQNLLGLVDDFYKGNAQGIVVLYAAKDARYDDVVRVLDILRKVGGNRVALATLPAGSQTPGAASDSTNPGDIPAEIQDLINGSGSGSPLPGSISPLNPSTTTPIPTTPGSSLSPGSTTLPTSPSGLPSLPTDSGSQNN
ncbi:ExbD/TolR family protein [Leptothoe kymatousa]|uniref:Biopolymer transporter ExbD n=1 Tax=Leptothoe kymatousa TAU-MAC 1615 TaxID=2364775 RepID=A0ABS5Y466_9CYAN|nr:biopolymer transporter ExbD [Leptothoe kymatousa]MBT9312639.1 biopolymer transporter ExbD [Leptothoe kymatousa TAU-MAC 1615]